jgi:hypothetical protein
MRISSNAGSAADATTAIIPGVDEFVVPAQLPPLEHDSHFAGENWIRKAFKTCLIWLSTERHLHAQSWLTVTQMRQAGFISPGVFQRLVAMLVVYCQSASDKELDLTSVRLHEELVVLKIAGQYFRLQLLKNENALRLDVVGER